MLKTTPGGIAAEKLAALIIILSLALSSHGQRHTRREGGDAEYAVAFASFAPLDTDLFVADADGGNARPLPHPDLDYNASFSRDGRWIMFTSERHGSADIYRARPDGTGLKRLTTSPGNDAHAAWSPDGKWITFSSARGGFKDEAALHPYNPQPYGEIYVMRADGSDVRRLTDNQYEEATPSWIPPRRIKGKAK